jgi:predicted transcriptional regulator
MIQPNEKGLYQFNDRQIEEQARKQQDFLRIIHPFLNEIDAYHQECIELRPIPRQKDVHFMKSLNLWRLDDKAMEQHIKFLQRLNEIPVCLYYSVYAYDYSKETYRKDGKPYAKGKINNQNARFTSIAICDLDKISEERHSEVIGMFEGCGIEPLTVFSGHGFQDIVLLNEQVYDIELLKRFNYILKSKGFPIDETIVDPARIMRMPFSFNCKAFCQEDKYHDAESPVAIPTKLVRFTDKRYAVEEIFDRLNTLPDIKTDFSIQINMPAKEAEPIEAPTRVLQELSKAQVEELSSIYNIIRFKELPDAVQRMLYGTREGFRNKTLLFLTMFFANKLGLPLQKIIQTLVIWGARCNPVLAEEYIIANVTRIYRRKFKGNGKYDSQMVKEFGYIDFKMYRRDHKVLVRNEFFELFHILSDGAVRVYLAAKLHEKMTGERLWTICNLVELTGFSTRTLHRHLQQLTDCSLIDKKRYCRSKGEQYRYCTNKFFDVTKGFLSFETATLEYLLKQGLLTDGELKLYVYLCHKINQSAGSECWLSQKSLGKDTAKKRNSVSEMTTSLHKKGLIKKTAENSGKVTCCYYTLIY